MMIIKYPENLCIICGAEIPEGRAVCPMCGATEATMFEKCKANEIEFKNNETEFKINDEIEQAYRQGFEAGMKNSCMLKQDNERLSRENAMLRSQIMKRFRTDDIDSEYE